MGFGTDFKTDSTFWDSAEEIPDGYIIQREIEKAVNGKPFFYNNDDGKPIRLQAVSAEEFFYYYQIWEDFHVLRVLPHGRGTLAERRWLIDLIKIFERIYNQVEAMIEERIAKKIRSENDG